MDLTTDIENVGGLTEHEAETRLREVGPNSTAADRPAFWRCLLNKFSSPIAWMLEAAIILQLALGSGIEAGMTAALLAFNASMGLVQESRAGSAFDALKRQLAPTALVRRDGMWRRRPAADVVPDDLVRIGLGAMIPADATILSGGVQIDEAVLTGESMPRDAGPGDSIFAGALVRRGEAVAVVTATGLNTSFGRTAELVRTASHASTEQGAVLAATRNLAIINGTVAALIIGYGYHIGLSEQSLGRLALTALLATIPVALPATFTLSAAFAAQSLAKFGVLLTRLSSAHEAAAMDVLCADKTGTLTRNVLELAEVVPMVGFDARAVLEAAAIASSETDEDPFDIAVQQAWGASSSVNRRISFVPFDPATKRAEAFFRDETGQTKRAVKGALEAVASVAPVPQDAWDRTQVLASAGHRVIGVAVGAPEALQLVGLLAISDPPRDDSRPLIAELAQSGVRTLMLSGDSSATAAAVATAVGIKGAIAPTGEVVDPITPEKFAVFPRVTPEGKLRLVQSFQAKGHVVGMCGDGTNDAPALRQAQIGIAVFNATDAAKAAAGMVLTRPGLEGIVAAIREGRIGFQRLLTYTFNMLVKKTEIVLFLALGLVLTGHPVLTPTLMVLLFLTNDFLSMSLTTDRATPSPSPSVWRMGNITLAAVLMGIVKLAFSLGVLIAVKARLHLDETATRTLAFVVLVFGNQAVLYVLRERRHLWASRPSTLVVAASLIDISLACLLVLSGILMIPLTWEALFYVAGAAVILAILLDQFKLLLTAYIKVE